MLHLKLWKYHLLKECILANKFYIRRNNNKSGSIKTERIVIAHLIPYSDQENYMYSTLF